MKSSEGFSDLEQGFFRLNLGAHHGLQHWRVLFHMALLLYGE